MLACIGEQGFAGGEIPFPPWRDDADIRLQGVRTELKTHLVITLACRAVRDGVGAGHACDFNQTLGDEWAGNRGSEQIFAFVDRIRPEHREDEIPHKFLAQIVNKDFLYPQQFRLAARGFQLFTLTHIGGEGDNFTVVGFLQPLQDDRGIEAAGVGEHDFLDRASGHGGVLPGGSEEGRHCALALAGASRRLASGFLQPEGRQQGAEKTRRVFGMRPMPRGIHGVHV